MIINNKQITTWGSCG